MKFRIIEFLGVIAVISFSLASFRHSDQWLESLFFPLTIGIILFSVAMALGRSDERKFFWLAFAITSFGYLIFAHVPYESRAEDSWAHQHELPWMRYDGPELTTQALRYAYSESHQCYLDNVFSEPDDDGDDVPSGGGDAAFTQFASELKTATRRQQQLERGELLNRTDSSQSQNQDVNPFGDDSSDEEIDSSENDSLQSQDQDDDPVGGEDDPSDEVINPSDDESSKGENQRSQGGFGGNFGGGVEFGGGQSNATSVDFQPLIELINNTIDSDTWGDNGQGGVVGPYPPSWSGTVCVISNDLGNDVDDDFAGFMRTGHCSWALLFGWCAGHLALLFSSKTKASSEEAQGLR